MAKSDSHEYVSRHSKPSRVSPVEQTLSAEVADSEARRMFKALCDIGTSLDNAMETIRCDGMSQKETASVLKMFQRLVARGLPHPYGEARSLSLLRERVRRGETSPKTTTTIFLDGIDDLDDLDDLDKVEAKGPFDIKDIPF